MAKNLKIYHEKRDFKKTSEPKGKVSMKQSTHKFVIQKHAASHLHYDFRLEIDGVLVSWAIPKGPSLNPHDKRLAVMTEDHPMEYRNFEGTIPEGSYGAGTVMIWDTGTYTNIKALDMQECLNKGSIEVNLHGKKLHGAFALVRMKGHDDKQWLFIKMDDEYTSEKDIVKSETKSAVSNKTMEEIGKSGKVYGE